MKRRQVRFHRLDETAADAEGLLRSGYDRAGNWSLAQVADHLTLFMRLSIEGFGFRLPWYLRMGGPIAKRIVLRNRWIPSGVKAPRQFVPSDALEDSVAVASLRQMCERVASHSGPWQASPLMGKLTPEEWREVHLVHAEHHLSFLIPKLK